METLPKCILALIGSLIFNHCDWLNFLTCNRRVFQSCMEYHPAIALRPPLNFNWDLKWCGEFTFGEFNAVSSSVGYLTIRRRARKYKNYAFTVKWAFDVNTVANSQYLCVYSRLNEHGVADIQKIYCVHDAIEEVQRACTMLISVRERKKYFKQEKEGFLKKL